MQKALLGEFAAESTNDLRLDSPGGHSTCIKTPTARFSTASLAERAVIFV